MTVWQISDISVEECAEGTVSASFVSEGEELNGIEDNNFENFEDNAKYTSIGDYYGKKADFYAKFLLGLSRQRLFVLWESVLFSTF